MADHSGQSPPEHWGKREPLIRQPEISICLFHRGVARKSVLIVPSVPFYPVLLPPGALGGQREPRIRQPKISPICPIRAFLQRFLPVDNFFFTARSGAAGTRRSPCRRDVPALAAQAAQERSAGSRGYPSTSQRRPADHHTDRGSLGAPGRGSARAAGRGIQTSTESVDPWKLSPAGGSGRELRIRRSRFRAVIVS